MAGGMHYDKDGRLVPSFDASGEWDHRMRVPESKPVTNTVAVSAQVLLHSREDGLYLELIAGQQHALFNLSALVRGRGDTITQQVVQKVYEAVQLAKRM